MKTQLEGFGSVAMALVFLFAFGCSGSSKPIDVADQNDIAKYAAETEQPTDVDPELMGED